MKLSCIRCKQKKLRCNRAEPCDKCTVAGAVCATAERKTRVSHKPKDKAAINSLNQKISILEKALQKTESPLSPLQKNSTLGSDQGIEPLKGKSTVGVDTSTRLEGWLGQELQAAKDYSISHLADRGRLSHISPLSVAINALDGAITNLEDNSEGIGSEDPLPHLTKAEAKQAVGLAIELMNGEWFTSLLDNDFMVSLSDVINSPHVQIDAAARLVYYNLVYHGLVVQGRNAPTSARALHLRCLQAVPAWQKSQQGAVMDLIAASLMTWTCALNFDLSLSWKFHCQACQFARRLGLHHLDVLSTKHDEDEPLQQKQRTGYWQLVLIDLFFRLFFRRESAISADASPRFVKLPELANPAVERPRAVATVGPLIWLRIIFIAKDFCDHFDRVSKTVGGLESAEFQEKVDSLCDEIEDMFTDWNIDHLMKTQGEKFLQSWTYADLALGANNVLLQMDKLRLTSKHTVVSRRSIRAARVIIDSLLDFHQMTISSKEHQALYMHGIAFYPFRAVFSLYYHILSSSNPEEYKDDISRLERLAAVMATAGKTRSEYIPVANAVASLNHVAKHVQLTQTSQSPTRQWDGLWSPSTFQLQDQGFCVADSVVSQKAISCQPVTTADQQTHFAHWLPEFDGIQFATVQDFQHAAELESFQPLEYMQAVENEFTGRDWGTEWWNVAIDEPLP